jgi:uncharacterized protein YoaH (UPF0181 family)
MELPTEPVTAFRKTFDIAIEGRSHEEAVENFREQIGGGVSSSEGITLVLEEIYGWEDRSEPVDRPDVVGEPPYDLLPIYPAKATLAALTDSRLRADAAFSRLTGSLTYAVGEPELYFNAMEPGPSEEGTIVPPSGTG